MDREDQTLIELLNCFIHRKEPQIPVDIDWDDVVYLAAINSVLGIISYMISRFRLEEDEEVLAACKAYYEKSYRHYHRLIGKKNELVALFQKQGIDHVLFKGAVVRELYPIPEFRSFGDIDILIRKEQREQSRQLMKENGYDESDAWEPVFTYKKGREYYELHTELLETDLPGKPRCRESFLSPWEHAVCVEEHSYRFTKEFHFRYLLTHIAKHFVGSGAGIRMYMDLAVYVMHYGKDMDWNAIRADLEEMGLLEFAETAMTAVKVWFSVESPLAVSDKSEEFLDRFTEHTLYGGTFGKQDKDSGTLDLSKEQRRTGKNNRVIIVLKRLFPPAKQIEPRYTYLQKRPWLLPVAWIHRFIITGGSRERHKKELKQILTSDVKEAEEFNRILQESGL